MSHQETISRTVRDVIQEAMNNFDPQKVLADLDKQNPSLDGQIRTTVLPKSGKSR
jgi:hypothetical protein